MSADFPTTPNPVPEPMLPKEELKLPPQQNEPEKLLPSAQGNSFGAFVGILIIVAILIIGALYFWGSQLSEKDKTTTEVPIEQTE